MKSLSCRDAGFDCDHIVQAENVNDLFREEEKNVFNAHGMKKQDFIPAFNEKMRSLIRDS
jgi:predicted small metal-binding protein